MLNNKPRINREKKTVEIMIKKYCQNKHSTNSLLCNECSNLFNYSSIRLNLCIYGEEKPACKKCNIHCYNQEMRQKIIDVMRFSGPRIILSHPILCLKHLLNI